jgi:hypothetical protein
MNSPNLVPCPDCGASVSRNAYTCPQCGRKIRSTPINLVAKFVIGAVAACILVPILWTVVKEVILPAPKTDDDTMKRMADEQQKTYLKQLSESQKAKK